VFPFFPFPFYHHLNKKRYLNKFLFEYVPSVLDVLVEDNGHAHCKKRVEIGGHEHDRDAEEQADQRKRPVVESEAGSPVGCAQQCLQGAGQVHEAVAHQEEHGKQWRQDVNISYETDNNHEIYNFDNHK